MQTAAEYLSRTESAVRHLFAGIEQYIALLREVTRPVFVTGTAWGPEQDVEFERWCASNASQLTAARDAERRFMAEAFALDTLCGAVLHVAEKALEIYARGTEVPTHLSNAVGPKLSKYCVGRIVRTVPLGLAVYAARNQHTHFNDGSLKAPSAAIFEALATGHGCGRSGERIVDPAFDLGNPGLVSYASNVTALIGWRDYDSYFADMQAMVLPGTGVADDV